MPFNHANKVSYNRPFVTRSGGGGGGAKEDWFMNAEYPMIRFLESNGYDLSYTTDLEIARNNFNSVNLLLNHKIFLSVGHDEYWSKEERNSVEAAKTAGKNLAFFSGNEIYWKTRWENSVMEPIRPSGLWFVIKRVQYLLAERARINVIYLPTNGPDYGATVIIRCNRCL
jgi:hypothetical protein